MTARLLLPELLTSDPGWWRPDWNEELGQGVDAALIPEMIERATRIHQLEAEIPATEWSAQLARGLSQAQIGAVRRTAGIVSPDSARGAILGVRGLAAAASDPAVNAAAMLFALVFSLPLFMEAQRLEMWTKPVKTVSPIARFLHEDAWRLPWELARDVLRHLHDLRGVRSGSATSYAPGYGLSLAASHLAELAHSPAGEAVRALLDAADFAGAIESLRPAWLSEETAANYRLALLNAIDANHHTISERMPSQNFGPSGGGITGGRRLGLSLTKILDSPAGSSAGHGQGQGTGATGATADWGLRTNQALAVPQGVEPLLLGRLGRLLAAVEDSDLPVEIREAIQLLIQLMVQTGWPLAFIAVAPLAEQTADGPVVAIPELHFQGRGFRRPDRPVEILVGEYVAQSLAQAHGLSPTPFWNSLPLANRQLDHTDLERASRWAAEVAGPYVTQAELRGAIWFEAYLGLGWPPERVSWVTANGVQSLQNDVWYQQATLPIDARPLHDHMQAWLEGAVRAYRRANAT